MAKLSIVWMRRNLRLKDNKPLASALAESEKILPIFIFDTEILKRFANPQDRRLSFIASTLYKINQDLKKLGGQILVLHGRPVEIIPKVLQVLDAEDVYADEDFEPANIRRDNEVSQLINDTAELHLFCDHLLIKPGTILNQDKQPYKVYTPFMKEFRRKITNELLKEYDCDLTNKFANIDLNKLTSNGLKIVKLDEGEKKILQQIGYAYKADNLWHADPSEANSRLDKFITNKISTYKDTRDLLDSDGTSAISPYLRFGLVSVRECYRRTLNIENVGTACWVNELIWREFYAMILYHFPEVATQEFQVKYRGKIPWQQDYSLLEKFTAAKTGFPIIDAAVRQLVQDGWMHNRARMIVASFLTKNLFLDWRLGEEFFAQYLMDYDLASNVGGWQWSASCGTDAQPYFRIFNPFTQGQNFDPNAKYIKKYLPELKPLEATVIHNQKAVEANFEGRVDYPRPIVSYKDSRQQAINIFKSI